MSRSETPAITCNFLFFTNYSNLLLEMKKLASMTTGFSFNLSRYIIFAMFFIPSFLFWFNYIFMLCLLYLWYLGFPIHFYKQINISRITELFQTNQILLVSTIILYPNLTEKVTVSKDHVHTFFHSSQKE